MIRSKPLSLLVEGTHDGSNGLSNDTLLGIQGGELSHGNGGILGGDTNVNEDEEPGG